MKKTLILGLFLTTIIINSCALHISDINNISIIAEKMPQHNIKHLPDKILVTDEYIYVLNSKNKILEKLYIFETNFESSCFKITVGDPYGSIGSMYIFEPDKNNRFKLHLTTLDLDCSFLSLDSNYALYNITFYGDNNFMDL